MANKFRVITMCGSTKFKDDFYKIAKILTERGNIVLMPHCYNHTDNEVYTDEVKQTLIGMHYQMIDMADEIFVVNKHGYIGENTTNEINYAADAGKTITYLE